MSSSDARFRTLTLIWFALAGGMLLYTGVAAGLILFGGVTFDALDPGVMRIAGPLVLMWMLATLPMRRLMVARVPSDLPDEERFARYQSAAIVGLALMETGGLLMITLGLMTGMETWVLAGGGAATVLMSLARPSRQEFDRI